VRVSSVIVILKKLTNYTVLSTENIVPGKGGSIPIFRRRFFDLAQTEFFVCVKIDWHRPKTNL
jgi:hypothetical protein